MSEKEARNDLNRGLPAPGTGRWWKVEILKGSRTSPIKLSLMECYTPGRRALSVVLMYRRTIASTKAIVETAEEMMVQVADYADLVGEYGDGA